MVRILIAEDDALQALALKQFLERSGHEVVGTAVSGAQAVRRAESSRPQVVLMDIKLRGSGSGIEAAAEIRSRLGIPHLFITAYADEQTLRRAWATRPLGYIAKPYTPRAIERALDAAGFGPHLPCRR